ncbi:MAG: PD-(D/E)XK nuclease family protein [Clostridiales bacterium]|nr:PD-(D/E)XK nuclease family protein [Clostridiales bacterium]MCF8022207.1 PD-(D/E)XK nuclease family protein [Clostridiales bacterium]
MSLLDDEFYFSQSSLHAYKTCPLKFRLRYIDGLYWPVECDSALKLSSEIGRTFHLAAQRYFLGIPPGFPGGEMGKMIQDWYNNLTSCFSREIGTWMPEISLKLNRSSLHLAATYDAVYLPGDSGTVTILDWKTGQVPPRWKTLRSAMQTMVYRYLMVEAGEAVTGYPVSPGGVEVIYWNPRFPDTRVVIKYSDEDYYQDKRVLEELVQEIKNCKYNDFVSVEDPKVCSNCEYRMMCRGMEPEKKEEYEDDELNISSWDDVPEISY